MRFGRQFILTLLAVIWSHAAVSQDVVAPEPEIEATIGGQIDAFLVDDFAKALTFASPGIQGMIGSPERFGQMVRNGYPMVWRPGDVQYLELRSFAGSLWQRVKIRDQTGTEHWLDYQMVRDGDAWRINGVQLLRRPDVGA